MPKLSCPCGKSINLSVIPNEHEFPLFGDEQLEDLQERLASEALTESELNLRRRKIGDIFAQRKPNPELIECPTCGRIALFSPVNNPTPVTWYRAENADRTPVAYLRSIFLNQNDSLSDK